MRLQRFLNLCPPVGKCVYVIRFRFSHEPFLLSHTRCPFLLWNIIFSCRRQEELRGARTWMNWSVSLERSQCDKLNNHLPPYVNQFIYKRRCRREDEDSRGKMKTDRISCFLGLIWEKLHLHLENSSLLSDGHLNWQVFKKFFVFSFCSP